MKLEGGYLLSHVYVIYTRQNSLCVLIAHDYEFTSMGNIWKFCFETFNAITWVNMQQQKNESRPKGLFIYDK